MNRLVPPSKSLGYSDIYLDFVAGNDPPQSFYPGRKMEEVAARLDATEYAREKMTGILRRQNSQAGASPATMDMIDRLTDPRGVCVFSGQQAGFLGGPLLTLIKALAVVKAAHRYSRQLERPVIPVFWIAGDDHDFEEANHTWVLDRQGQPARLAYTAPPEQEISTSGIFFSDSDELRKVKEQLRESLGETDFTAELYELIDRCYTPEETFTTAFAKFMAALTRDTGLVLFSPGDEEVKRHAVPFFKDILQKQDELHDAIGEANQALVDSGYHLQVEKKEDSAHLFFDVEGRKPVIRDNGLYLVGEKVFTQLQLEQCVDSCPQRFSPDVMTRPVLQSYLFPVLSQKGGPAEIAYLAQINPLFELFSLPAPVHMARPTASLIEARFEKLMKELDISFEEVTGDIELVVNRILSATFPEHLDRHMEELKTDVQSKFRHLIDDALQFDLSMQKYAEQVLGKVDFAIKSLEGKAFAAHKKRSKETRDRIYRLEHALHTNRGLQERSLNITYFLSRYGLGLLEFLMEQLDSEEKAHQLIYLSEMET